MPCLSCQQRGELLVKAREAYRRGDKVEAKRCLMEAFGTIGKDFNRFVFKQPDGTDERFDFTPDKPE